MAIIKKYSDFRYPIITKGLEHDENNTLPWYWTYNIVFSRCSHAHTDINCPIHDIRNVGGLNIN